MHRDTQTGKQAADQLSNPAGKSAEQQPEDRIHNKRLTAEAAHSRIRDKHLRGDDTDWKTVRKGTKRSKPTRAGIRKTEEPRKQRTDQGVRAMCTRSLRANGNGDERTHDSRQKQSAAGR